MVQKLPKVIFMLLNGLPDLLDGAPVGGHAPRRPRAHVPHVEVALAVAAHDQVRLPGDARDGRQTCLGRDLG